MNHVYAPPFWLSHHRLEDVHKCFVVGGIHICSRCLGTYPVLFATLVVQLKRPFAPVVLPYDPWLFFVLPLPALVDWAASQFSWWRGNNALRFLSGCVLGVGLGRCVYVNMRHPGDVRVLVQVAGLSIIAGIVWGLRQMLGLAPSKPESADHPPVDPDGPFAR
jgi:uncharacterized membrane protein